MDKHYLVVAPNDRNATVSTAIYILMRKLLNISNFRTQPEESQAWQMVKNGDRKALAYIFHGHYHALLRYGTKLTADEEIVKDCIQGLFEKLWNRREKLSDVRAVGAYLKMALHHLIIDERNYTLKVIDTHTDYSRNHSFTYSYEEIIIAEQTKIEQTRTIEKMMGGLSERQKEAVRLRIYEGLEYHKISEMMSLNVQSVRNLIHQSMKILRKQFHASRTSLPKKFCTTQVATTRPII